MVNELWHMICTIMEDSFLLLVLHCAQFGIVRKRILDNIDSTEFFPFTFFFLSFCPFHRKPCPSPFLSFILPPSLSFLFALFLVLYFVRDVLYRMVIIRMKIMFVVYSFIAEIRRESSKQTIVSLEKYVSLLWDNTNEMSNSP